MSTSPSNQGCVGGTTLSLRRSFPTRKQHPNASTYGATKHLLLDNFEQVLPAAIQLAALLATAPQLTLMETSRAALHLASEYEYPVAPLALPTRGQHLTTPQWSRRTARSS